MLRRLFLMTLLAGATAAPAQAARDVGCSQEAIATTLNQQVKRYREITDSGFGGIGQLRCADYTGDGTDDVLYLLESGGTGGAFDWGVIVGDGESARVATTGSGGSKLAIAVLKGRPQVANPIYLKGDANCCPRGGSRVRTFRWNGARFVLGGARKVKALPKRFDGTDEQPSP